MKSALVLAIALIALAAACSGRGGAPAVAQDAGYPELIVQGEDAPNGIYDPSLEYGPDGTGWLAYSAVRAGRDGQVETRIARSDDGGASWRRVARVNSAAPAAVTMPGGKSVRGRWWHEVPTLVHDPDDPGREWKLFWHRYVSRLPHRNAEDRLFAFGWIAMRHAPSPDGPWSQEVPLIGAGPFPPSPFKTVFNIGDLHPDLKQYIVLTEPGSLYRDGRLYLTLQAVRHPRLGKNKHDIILISSADHGATWQYVATVLKSEQAARFGANWYTGSSLAEEDGRIFLLVTPEVAGKPMTGHRGTVVFEFNDVARGTLKRDPAGSLTVIRYLKPNLPKGGQSDYDAGNVNGGLVMPQFDIKNLPTAFRLYSTGATLARN